MTYQAQVDDLVIVVVPHGENFRGTVTKALAKTNRFGRRCWYVTVQEEGEAGATFSFAQRDIWDGAHSNFTGAKELILIGEAVPNPGRAIDPEFGEDGTPVFQVMERDNSDFPSTMQQLFTHRTREGAVKRVKSLIEKAGGIFDPNDEQEWAVDDKEFWVVEEYLGG